MGGAEFRFKIETLHPGLLPLDRLIAYLGELAKVLGEPTRLHLVGVERGSFVGVIKADQGTTARVMSRVRSVKTRSAPEEALQAYRQMNQMLAQDRTTGSLIQGKAQKILYFPGSRELPENVIGPIDQDGALDGKLIRIGGRSNPCPVSIEHLDGSLIKCTARWSLARDFAAHIYGDPVRVFGTGRWYRYERSGWKLERFRISNFQELTSDPLPLVINRLRTVPGAQEWEGDPWEDLDNIRHGRDEIH